MASWEIEVSMQRIFFLIRLVRKYLHGLEPVEMERSLRGFLNEFNQNLKNKFVGWKSLLQIYFLR